MGYPGLAYLPRRTRLNPADLVLNALRVPNQETRLVEALPWVLLRYPDMDWDWLLRHAKVLDLQNRLGFLVTLARALAERRGDTATAAKLAQREGRLEHSRLAREDTLCRESMTAAERRWLRTHRSAEAAHWNLLTDLAPDHLPHAG